MSSTEPVKRNGRRIHRDRHVFNRDAPKPLTPAEFQVVLSAVIAVEEGDNDARAITDSWLAAGGPVTMPMLYSALLALRRGNARQQLIDFQSSSDIMRGLHQ